MAANESAQALVGRNWATFSMSGTQMTRWSTTPTRTRMMTWTFETGQDKLRETAISTCTTVHVPIPSLPHLRARVAKWHGRIR